ncbi:MAG: hypothetical protein PVI59_17270, partial [Anaerolineae bacterium]
YRIVAGPTEAGTLDDLYPGGDLPPELVALLGDLVWCDSRADWQDMDDPTLVHLTPHEKPRGL